VGGEVGLKKRRHIRTNQQQQLAKLKRPAHRKVNGQSGKAALSDALVDIGLKFATALIDHYLPNLKPQPPAYIIPPRGLLNDSKTIDLTPDQSGAFSTPKEN
jgi:hypothetical protein